VTAALTGHSPRGPPASLTVWWRAAATARRANRCATPRNPPSIARACADCSCGRGRRRSRWSGSSDEHRGTPGTADCVRPDVSARGVNGVRPGPHRPAQTARYSQNLSSRDDMPLPRGWSGSRAGWVAAGTLDGVGIGETRAAAGPKGRCPPDFPMLDRPGVAGWSRPASATVAPCTGQSRAPDRDGVSVPVRRALPRPVMRSGPAGGRGPPGRDRGSDGLGPLPEFRVGIHPAF